MALPLLFDTTFKPHQKLRIRAIRALFISKYAFKHALYYHRSIPRVLLKGKGLSKIVYIYSNISLLQGGQGGRPCKYAFHILLKCAM